MTPVTKPIRAMLDRAQSQFVRGKPGSVLILVVALLVLMALIGTAFMTMAQFDRASAAQHSLNTSLDLTLEGVVNQVKGVVAGDLFANGLYRPAMNTGLAGVKPVPYNSNTLGAYPYYNGLGLDAASVTGPTTNVGDWWLAGRIPVLPVEGSPFTMTGTTPNMPRWSFITAPLDGEGAFNGPDAPATAPIPTEIYGPWYSRTNLYPCMTGGFPYLPTKVAIDGQLWPAFYDPASGKWVMAADADGDGIADSGLVKLSTIDGITYYYAVRIVDNAAAVNANVALRPNAASTYSISSVAASTIPGDFTPVNIDLEGMLVNTTPTNEDLYGGAGGNTLGLLNYRFSGNTLDGTPVNDSGVKRGDFNFISNGGFYFDQQWMQLGRRLANPGYGVAGTVTYRFRALPVAEDMALVRNFVLKDPALLTAPQSPSVLEQRMPNTLFYAAPSQVAPYTPDDVISWWGNSAASPPVTGNFDYYSDYGFTGGGAINNIHPMRALIVGHNPVSNFSPVKFRDLGSTAVSTYTFGDMISYKGPSGAVRRYVCINPGTAAAPIEPGASDPNWQDSNWAFEPWLSTPTKTSVNTATFQQLYAAYWAVMADQYTPGSGAAPPQWDPAFPNVPTGERRMFRNPIRSAYPISSGAPPPGTASLTNRQVMYLRAALAAVNTMDLRDADDDVTSRTIFIPNAANVTQFKVNVYGAEKQPYLTHIYARNDPDPANATNDYMVIEFYNPYSTAIDISGWKLAIVDRSNPSQLTLTALDGTPTGKTLKQEVTNPAPLLTIGPKSFVVLLSNISAPKTILLPSPLPPNFYECQDLMNAFGKELVLMRPRLAAGNPITGALANNTFDETAATNNTTLVGLYDWIPVDSYDFTNMPQTSKDTKNPQEWEYLRPDDPASGKNWHFVYPGPWQLTAAGAGGGGGGSTTNGNPTWSATVSTAAGAVPPQTDLATKGFGGYQKAPLTGGGAATYQDVTIQVNNTDFGGPLKPTAGGPNFHPLGAFLRNGDILQVPFVGAYKIVDVTVPATPKLVELNSLTTDSAVATSQDLTDNYKPIANSAGLTAENIGRFCPIDGTDAANAGTANVDDFGTTAANWRYQWATQLFDYLTIQAPQDDYLPDVDPWRADPGYPTTYRYPPATTATNVPQPVSNTPPGNSANSGLNPGNLTTFVPLKASEESVGVNGLVNVNSAPWRTLAAVPWVPASNPNFRKLNAQVAMAIVQYRDGNGATPGHGPFRNLFELNKVPLSGAGLGNTLRDVLHPAATTPFSLAEGNLSPVDQATNGTDQVTGDFEGLFNTITRMSNLITTRSDSYTAYILVQGWRNAETATPHLVAQRRAAVIIDRTPVTPDNPTPNVTFVPMK